MAEYSKQFLRFLIGSTPWCCSSHLNVAQSKQQHIRKGKLLHVSVTVTINRLTFL